MNKTYEIRKAIAEALESTNYEVYNQRADENAQYPYLVYDLPNSVDDGTLENFVLEVDGWDAPTNGDTTVLENMMDAADITLQRKSFIVGSLTVMIYRDNRESLIDDDKRIRRRKNIYQVRVYGE